MKTRAQLLEEAHKLLENVSVVSPSAAHVRIQKAFALMELAKMVGP